MWGFLLFHALLTGAIASSGADLGWHFVQNGTTGIVALEATVISPTLVLMFDRPVGAPLTINDHAAWGGLWNLETNQARALNVVSNSFCASGGYLSNGTMVSVGGMTVESPSNTTLPADEDGRMAIRIWEPCDDPAGVGCTLVEDPDTLHLAQPRWYPSALRVFDGSLMVVGGMHYSTPFWNMPNETESSFEFFPSKDGGVPRFSPFLNGSLPANLFPRAFTLPDGKIFIVANNQSVIYDIETRTETPLPDLPNGVRVTNPLDGTATLLPLSPPDYVPEILVCGGSNKSDQLDYRNFSSQDPASDQCSRITLTPEGIKQGWEVELMPEPRIMPEMVLMPDGQVVIINGGRTGYAAYGTFQDSVGQSNADHAVRTPVLYHPAAPRGRRFDREGLPTSDIARLYHSSVTLTPSGNLFVAGSNPNGHGLVTGVKFPSEYRAEYLNPPYMTVPRPLLANVPEKIGFNERFSVDIHIPDNLNSSSLKVALIDLGFSTHAFHSSSRLVFMEAKLSEGNRKLEILTPPNNRVYPPGPAWIYVTVDSVTSVGAQVMVGSGAAPPVPDQGVRL
ncbi:glyoxal oxidase precursor [Dendrothele bispora CBS 962.96]|uniref:Glyoxal oxidase n=1 Tax=Dendrothele bispora (strain CBS 962.96) TaxID=1314807 RepID=A0A4S8M5V7_DENBC|nr:glyoxal oxidase precursor [Dendrothele bispora CBS 962.96]